MSLLATDLRIVADENHHLLIPIVRYPSENDSSVLRKQAGFLEFGRGDFQAERKPLTVLDSLQEKLPSHVLAIIPRSIDIVGGIAILEITPELNPYKAKIGEAILAVNKNVRTVLSKASPISTQYRVREFEVLAGDDCTETMHNEYGCRYILDLRKVYFSPRLGYEHDRISRLVTEGETVIDMFAGIGPFSIPIAKRRSSVMVYAIDVNPEAIRYLKENIKLNKVEGKVTPFLGDCKNIVDHKLRGIADRVIMNLPGESLEYADTACQAIKPTGGIMHLYTFSDEKEPFNKLRDALKRSVLSAGRSVKDVETRIVKEVAPYKLQVAVDAKVT